MAWEGSFKTNRGYKLNPCPEYQRMNKWNGFPVPVWSSFLVSVVESTTEAGYWYWLVD